MHLSTTVAVAELDIRGLEEYVVNSSQKDQARGPKNKARSSLFNIESMKEYIMRTFIQISSDIRRMEGHRPMFSARSSGTTVDNNTGFVYVVRMSLQYAQTHDRLIEFVILEEMYQTGYK